MAKSSIHIEAGKEGYLAHNDRSQKTVNSIFSDEKNEIWNSKKEGFELYRFELAARSEAYQKRTGQKLQKKAITHLSSIVNLNQNHSLADVKKVAKLLENKLDTKVFQIAIHRDEGHIENGKPIKNYHAHIEFLGLDSDGYSVRKKLTKKMLSTLQNEVANTLQMERGINYAKEKKKRPKRLDTYEYKAHKKEESKAVLVSQSLLKRDIKILREKLRLQGAKREQYAKLEQLNRDLQERIKAKDLTIRELEKEVSGLYELAYEDTYERYDEYGRIVDRTYSYKEIFENAVYYKEVAQSEARELKWEVEELEEKLNIFNKEVTNLKEENRTLREELKKRVEELEKENVQLRNGFNIDINAEMMNLDFDDEDDEIEEKIYKQHVIAPKRRNMP